MKKRDPDGDRRPSESRTAAESRTSTRLSPQAIAGITAEFKATEGILAVARKKELAGVWNCTEGQVRALYAKLRAAARTAGTMPAPKKTHKKSEIRELMAAVAPDFAESPKLTAARATQLAAKHHCAEWQVKSSFDKLREAAGTKKTHKKSETRELMAAVAPDFAESPKLTAARLTQLAAKHHCAVWQVTRSFDKLREAAGTKRPRKAEKKETQPKKKRK